LRKTNTCDIFSNYSIKSGFAEVRKYGALFAEYFPTLKDGMYDPSYPQAGHPQDNNQETWASAFHDGYLHLKDFSDNANKFSDPLKSILLETVRLAMEP
jgi:hypothetical protein